MTEVSLIRSYDQSLDEDTTLVNSDADYVRACHALREAFSSEKPLKVWVRQKCHFDWLRNFTEQTNITCTFTEKTPRLILAEKWNVTIPDWLDDEMVTGEHLLHLPVDSEHPARFEDRMLVFFLGTTFYADHLESTNLSEIVVAVNSPEMAGHLSKYPVLRRCLEEKIKKWERRTGKAWVRRLCNELLKDAKGVWKDFTLWSLLAGYPEKLLNYVLPTERILWLKRVPLEALRDLTLYRVSIDQASTQIEMFFKDRELGTSIKSSKDFAKVLQCTSGRVTKEFQLVRDLLASNSFEVSRKDVSGVRNKFRSCPGVSTGNLIALERFVKPKRPSIPDKDESREADQWTKWVVEEYIPYRHWQTLNGYYDSEVESAVQLFSDWYLRAYGLIHQDEKKSLVHLLGHWGEKLRDDALSLILLIDSLPLTFWELLQNVLARAGFHRYELIYRFAPVPSYTEMVKRLILSGSWERHEKPYEDILTIRSEEDWRGKKIIYLPSLKALSELDVPDEACVAVLNFLALDEVLHSDVELKDTTYEEELHRLFTRLADSAKRLFEERQSPNGAFSLYVMTDHGASRILEEEKTSFDSKIVSKLFPDEKHRFSGIEKAEAAKIPQNLWDLGYRFNQPFVSEDFVYFIPRGHNTVKKPGIGGGYVHGGATPEEVLVPAAVFKLAKPAWKPLEARFLDLKIDRETGKASFYIQRVVPLRIEVQNPNTEAVRILQVDVVTPDTDVKSCRTPHIEASKYGVVVVECYFDKSAMENEELAVRFAYEIAGEEHVKDLKLAAEFKSAVIGGFSLKDLG